MALQLTKTNAQGFDGVYWKIVSLIFDYTLSRADCRIALYKDAAASSTHLPMEELEYVWSTDSGDAGADEWTGWFDTATLDALNQNPQERAYEKLKTLAEFSGATDV